MVSRSSRSLSDTPGRAGWTWYTGSAAWLHRVAVEWVVGVRAVWGGLLVDPCPIAEMGEVAPEAVMRLGLAVGPGLMLFYIAAVWFISRYSLTRDEHTAIVAELAARKEASPDAAE